MSSAQPNERVDNGAFIPTGAIYNEVQALKMEIVRIKTLMTVVGLFITPALSVIVSTVVVQVMEAGI